MRYKQPVKRALFVMVFALTSACSGDDPLQISRRWSQTYDSKVAAPAFGTAARVVVARAAAPGSIETLEALSGINIEGPFDTLPTPHAPVMVGTELFVVGQVSGRGVRMNLAGELLPFFDPPAGGTGPLVAAPDGSLRLTANRGVLMIIPADFSAHTEVPLTGVSDSPVSVDDEGITFVATDLGSVVGIDRDGVTRFDVTVPGPASGVSQTRDLVAVGALDGLYVFDRFGVGVFVHDRDARVVGTAFTDNGDIIAWGEDGRLDRVGPDGTPRFSVSVGAAIYAEVKELPTGYFAVLNAEGTASLISPDGVLSDEIVVAPDETEAPARQVAQGEGSVLYFSRGNTVAAFDFAFVP